MAVTKTTAKPAAKPASKPAVAKTTTEAQQSNIAPATEFNPSGAPVQTVPDVDAGHPAVDSNPRAGTTVDQNRIDFNDPTVTGAEAVAANLANQGVTAAEQKAD